MDKRSELINLYNHCRYVDLDSENSMEMLKNCSSNILQEVENIAKQYIQIEGFVDGEDDGPKVNLIEGFTDKNNCCPDGYKNENGNCKRVCINCKYNECNMGNGNIGKHFRTSNKDKKSMINVEMDNNIFNYIVSTEVDTN